MIIAISGRMASGKTTFANALADGLGGAVGSFGDYVRELAVKRGFSTERSSLQLIGQAAVESDPMGFVTDFMAWGGWDSRTTLVLDGLRHISVRNALRSHANASRLAIVFVHIEADDKCRLARLRARGEDDVSVALHDSHASEVDVNNALSDEADLFVQRTDDVGAMVSALVRDLHLHLSKS